MRGTQLTARAFPFPTVERVLPNGLRVFVVTHDSPGLVAYYSIVRTGSRNEIEPGKSGFAHFFEHMMFRGTPRYPTVKYNATIKQIGADSNAFTSDDLTVYHTLANKDALPTIVEIEADRFQNLDYSEGEFQKEAKAVLGEYNKGASDPMQALVEALYDQAFQVHTYKHTTIGFLKDIEDMPNQFAYSRQFFDRYYRPDNVLLLVVGDVTSETVFPIIEKHYGGWKAGPSRPSVPVEPPQTKEVRKTVPWHDAGLPTLLMGYHTPAFSLTSLDSIGLEVLAELVFSERSSLYRRLVLEEQKVEVLAGGNERRIDPNLFTILARVKDPKDLDYVEQAIYTAIHQIAASGIDAVTLAEVVSHKRYHFASQLSTAENVAQIGAEFLALTERLSSIDDYFSILSRVTVADIQRVARTYFVPANRTTITLQPEAL
jgi:zinc protease